MRTFTDDKVRKREIHKLLSGEIMKTSLQNAHAWVMWNIFSSLFNPTGRAGEGEVKLCAISNLWEGMREAGRRQLATQFQRVVAAISKFSSERRGQRAVSCDQPRSTRKVLCLHISILTVHLKLCMQD